MVRRVIAKPKTAGVLLLVGLVALSVLVLLYWTTARIDHRSFEQERALVKTEVDGLLPRMVRAQEQITVGDTVVLETHKTVLDLSRIESFFGPQLYFRLKRDGSYLLDGNDVAYYAMWKGARMTPPTLGPVKDAATPLLARLRAKMRSSNAQLREGAKTPDEADIVTVGGKLAAVSVKPIVGDSGRIIQGSGTEHVNVRVIELDDAYARRMASTHYLDGVRISLVDDRRDSEASYPFVSVTTGKPVGYFIWTPYAPGTMVMRHLLLPLLAGLALFIAIVFALIRRIWRNTAELEASEAQARHLAFHDTLTGLPNRALFDDRLDRALAGARRDPAHQMALLCLDLDRFKQVNDTLGHPAGDELIRELGRRLSAVVRDNDTVARLGGDEFAIIQTSVRSLSDIRSLCERIIATVAEPFDVVGSQAFVGMSIGVARSGIDGLDRTELARKADIALYEAKSRGRGRYVLFEDTMDESVQFRQTLEQELRKALDEPDQLQLHYQPLYQAATRSVSGVEALVRWHHPDRGLICPTVFIPIAEETGLIEPLGEWVLREACAAAAHWPVATISVNVSAIQARNPFFAQRVISILYEAGLDPHRLEIEISEPSFLQNIEQCQANLHLLRHAGVKIALDDFGTGYSSLNNLRSDQVDRVKIDRSFTTAIESSPEGSAIVRTIVALARSSGLKVTAEGIETPEQSTFLSAAGCDELQGFFMSRPMPLEEMDQMLGVDRAARRPPADRTAA